MIVVVNPLPIEGVSQIDDVDDLDDADVVRVIGLEHLQEVLERDVITDVLIVTVVHTSEIYDCIEVVEWARSVARQTRIVLACPNEVWALPYVAEARLLLARGQGLEVVEHARWAEVKEPPADIVGSDGKKLKSRILVHRWGDVISEVSSGMRLASFPDSEEAQRAAMLVEYLASSTRTGSQYRIVVTCALKSPYNLRELAREVGISYGHARNCYHSIEEELGLLDRPKNAGVSYLNWYLSQWRQWIESYDSRRHY